MAEKKKWVEIEAYNPFTNSNIIIYTPKKKIGREALKDYIFYHQEKTKNHGFLFDIIKEAKAGAYELDCELVALEKMLKKSFKK